LRARQTHTEVENYGEKKRGGKNREGERPAIGPRGMLGWYPDKEGREGDKKSAGEKDSRLERI